MFKRVANRQYERLILEAYDDFILSKKALLRSPKTITNYEYAVGSFIDWSSEIPLSELSSRHIRSYLAYTANRGVKDSTVATHARAIRVFVNFLLSEGYIEQPLRVDIPKVASRKMPVLSKNDLKFVLSACNNHRDKSLILLMVDTGLRRAEVCSLTWADIDLQSGLVRVNQGKGSKDRTVVLGSNTLRALLRHRRDVRASERDKVFGLRPAGLRMALERIGKRAGVHLNSHALRRTFATFALRAGINLLYLQAMMGHSSIDQTRKYIHFIDDDLLAAHREHGPIDVILSGE